MHKRLAISLAVIFLLAQTPMQQLLKLPLLFEHFEEHVRINHNVSLGDFLEMHYINLDKHTADPDPGDDHELPFKKTDLHIFTGVYAAPVSEYVFEAFTGPVNQSYSYPPDPGLLSSLRTSIWQPPRQS